MKKAFILMAGLGMLFSAQAQITHQRVPEKDNNFIQLDAGNANLPAQRLLSDKLKLKGNEEMRSLKTESDQLGFKHQKFQHYFQGIRVEGSTYTIHYKDGLASHMTGNYRPVHDIELNPSLSGDQALQLAKASTQARKFAWEEDASNLIPQRIDRPEGELVIVQNTPNGYKSRLAYKFHVIATDPYVNAFVYIDAISGEVVRYNSILKHAHGHGKPNVVDQSGSASLAVSNGTAATRYSGTQPIITDSNGGGFRLRDYSRGSGVLTYDATTSTNYNNATGAPTNASEYTDSNNNWTAAEFNNADKDNAALDAHFAAEATYDFFQTSFGRNSYDGNGAVITNYVNTDIENVFNYPIGYNDNAFWTGFVMVYGKGRDFDPLTTVDITGHEIGHAYCTGTADLVYERESGAMNEGLSDIWGACVENYTNINHGTTKDLWNLGNEIGATFRSMSNPKAFGDPDTRGGQNWVNANCANPNINNDYCGVHTNSGVANHWFYVLAVGETDTNDLGNAYSVTGIGVTAAAAITWRTEAFYLTTTSDYDDFRTFSIQSAVELYGSGSAQEIAVTNAWYAVGVGAAYVPTCGLAAPGGFASSNISNTGFTLSWNSVSGASSYNLIIGSTSTTVNGTSFTATGLTAGTTYNCIVQANCAVGGSGATSIVNVTTTGSAPVQYCASNGNTTSDEYIGRVQLNTIDNSTNASSGGYGNYTTISTTLTRGTSYTVTVTPHWTGTVYMEAYAVWIDYNHDGDFADSGEQVWSRSATTTTPVSGTFTVPNSAMLATTRMRVSMKYNGVPTSCESFSYGEVEDYAIVIGGSTSDTQAPSVPSSLAASNVTSSGFNISWTASTDNVGVMGYNVFLNGVSQGTTSGTSYSFTGLSASTTYAVAVSAFDAAGNTSGQASANVTTLSGGGSSSAVLVTGFFESGWDGWADGGSDVARYGGSRSYEGNFSIEIRDNSGTASAMSYTGVNVSSYDFIEIEFYFYANSMENGEDFWVLFYNGSTWQTVATYVAGSGFTNNNFYVATVTLDANAINFPTNAGFRFQCDASSNTDNIYIDAVTITGYVGSPPGFAPSSLTYMGVAPVSLGGLEQLENKSVRLYPNPVQDMLTIENLPEGSKISLYTLSGKLLTEGFDLRELNFSEASSGVYVVFIESAEIGRKAYRIMKK